MSEKTGHVIKLTFPFNEARCLEIYHPKLEDWFRVTANEFRSYNAKRRIHQFRGKLGTGERESYIEEYKGPTYIFDSNKKVNTTKLPFGIVFQNNKDPRTFQRRPYEQI